MLPASITILRWRALAGGRGARYARGLEEFAGGGEYDDGSTNDSGGAGKPVELQRMAAGGGAALPDEQSRSRGGGAATGSGGVWRDWEGGAELGVLSRDSERAGAAGGRRDAAGAERPGRSRGSHA